MSLEATVQRISAIRRELANPAAFAGASAVTGGVEAPAATPATIATPASTATPATAATPTGESSFASALQQASAGYDAPAGEASATTSAIAGPPPLSSYYSPQSLDGVAGSTGLAGLDTAGVGSPGARIVAVAESQLGQSEQPPGSNESPAIAQYRTATAGAVPGAPWCAYFASWAAREAGAPIGPEGQGAGAVEDVWSWAQSTGRAIPNGPGVVPQPGDLIVFGDEHVGIVRDVLPDGQIQTIEGNYENKVAANVRSSTEATGYVNMS
jgi:CHAP domain-containing protein